MGKSVWSSEMSAIHLFIKITVKTSYLRTKSEKKCIIEETIQKKKNQHFSPICSKFNLLKTINIGSTFKYFPYITWKQIFKLNAVFHPEQHCNESAYPNIDTGCCSMKRKANCTCFIINFFDIFLFFPNGFKLHLSPRSLSLRLQWNLLSNSWIFEYFKKPQKPQTSGMKKKEFLVK